MIPHTQGHQSERRYHRLASGRLGDNLLFLAKWLRSPFKVAAVLPSGSELVAAMSSAVPDGADGLIIELGAGTGTVTQGLLDRGIAPERLVVVEQDEVFYRLLRERFPQLRVLQGDAAELVALISTQSDLAGLKVGAIVSSLPVLAVPQPVRQKIFDASFQLLPPDGVFIQFTYRLFGPPIPSRYLVDMGLSAQPAGRAVRNVPSARVWKLSRSPQAQP